MKMDDEIEICMQDGTVIVGKLLQRRQTGIVVKKDEYYAFSREKTIPIEIFIATADIKKINKRDHLF